MKKLLIAGAFVLAAASLRAAVGCDLNDPDRDVKRIFPESTGYKTTYLSIKDGGGLQQLSRVINRLGDNFSGPYENIDVPYTLYEIKKGTATLGYIHGVNQKGTYGGIQVFLALDPQGTIQGFYIQKLTSRAATQLRSKSFARQFVGLSLKDFDGYNVPFGRAEGPVAAVRNPAPGAVWDFRAVMRAVKKNLILMDEFVYHGSQP